MIPRVVRALAALAIAGSSFAQTAPPLHVPLQETIGAAKPEVVPSLFVLNSKGAILQNGKLVLVGVSPNAIVFADRPVRAVGHDLTSRVVEDWALGSDNVQKDPPNATVGAAAVGAAAYAPRCVYDPYPPCY